MKILLDILPLLIKYLTTPTPKSVATAAQAAQAATPIPVATPAPVQEPELPISQKALDLGVLVITKDELEMLLA